MAMLARVTDLDVGVLRDAFENVCTKLGETVVVPAGPDRTGPKCNRPNYIRGGKL